MYKPETLTRRGSLRSLRSAPLLSTVLESTLSLTRIHPIASLELPGLDYAIQSQSALGGLGHHRELGTSLRSGIAAITAASASAAGGISQSQSALLGRYGPNASLRHNERKIVQPKRVLSRKLKPHLVADTVKQYISRAQRTTKKGTQEQQNNMEFLRGVYAFMQVSRSSVDYSNSSSSNVSGNGEASGFSGYEASLTTLPSSDEPATISPRRSTRTANSAIRTIRKTEKTTATAVSTTTAEEAAATWPGQASTQQTESKTRSPGQKHQQSQSQSRQVVQTAASAATGTVDS
ncbi:uncharacterized protein LOC117903800 isoform X6 [Drosophila subobscura]|uniref:uncharacterized protein LOC117903800 isoform X6 n=1 Tax=Drosophila subobscura TaxID=7241 RepID=UPI00155B384F|nr:uncharacterized protein LOC117903800 isoform X6 [Drosophila subobscura]